MNQFHYPFGQPLKKVAQKDRTPRKVFVLGVYASAVHACVTDKTGKTVARALAVASEPEIFWQGNNAADIIANIPVTDNRYRLTVPADAAMNGPSGRALDDYYLQPLGLGRNDVWLCDLLPESRINEKQQAAIARLGLTTTIPYFDEAELRSKERAAEIADELLVSGADTLVLLGDLPIRHFLKVMSTSRYRKLTDFGETPETYGRPVDIVIAGKVFKVLALCHPRQAARLGTANTKWTALHQNWVKRTRV